MQDRHVAKLLLAMTVQQQPIQTALDLTQALASLRGEAGKPVATLYLFK